MARFINNAKKTLDIVENPKADFYRDEDLFLASLVVNNDDMIMATIRLGATKEEFVSYLENLNYEIRARQKMLRLSETLNTFTPM